MFSHIALFVRIFRRAQQVERQKSVLCSISVLAIIDERDTVIILIHVDEFMSAYLKLSFSYRRILQRRPIHVAKLYVAINNVAINRRIKISPQHLVRFAPIYRSVKHDCAIACSQLDFLYEYAVFKIIDTLPYYASSVNISLEPVKLKLPFAHVGIIYIDIPSVVIRFWIAVYRQNIKSALAKFSVASQIYHRRYAAVFCKAHFYLIVLNIIIAERKLRKISVCLRKQRRRVGFDVGMIPLIVPLDVFASVKSNAIDRAQPSAVFQRLQKPVYLLAYLGIKLSVSAHRFDVHSVDRRARDYIVELI